MSLPPSLRASVTPPELELIACQQLVEIIPLIAMEKTAFISGAYGPLRPPHKARIPLWMAVNLKQKKKCHIIAPEWLSVDYLLEKLSQETSQAEFTQLPFRFAEISRVLLDVASDDLPNPEKVRTLLKDLREARQAKARAGLESLKHSTLGLSNLSAMEINEIRPFFIQAMAVLGQLRPSQQDP
ncbi:DNA replication complex GINS protein PSF2 [Mycena sp. CBHHK59/15]|nr:DNA replication complex GINS protein PSF2 [Mycena sp. CBHHK59/15]